MRPACDCRPAGLKASAAASFTRETPRTYAAPLAVLQIRPHHQPTQTYPLALNIISACWILFAVIWLLAAFWTKQSVYKEGRLQRLRYVRPILVGGFLLAKGNRLSDPLNLRVIPHVEALARTGVVLCV